MATPLNSGTFGPCLSSPQNARAKILKDCMRLFPATSLYQKNETRPAKAARVSHEKFRSAGIVPAWGLRSRARSFPCGRLFRGDGGLLALQVTVTTAALLDFIVLLSHS
jgi:hypothetical protein